MSGRKRAYVAAGLAFLYPGLGHVYLRTWLRAAAWFALALFTATMVLPESVMTAMGSGELDAMLAAAESVPIEAALAMLTVGALNVVDAYLVAARPGLVGAADPDAAAADPGRCPSCGKDLDAELDFCHWCTREIEFEREDDSGTPSSA